MSSEIEPMNDRKRKPTAEPEAVGLVSLSQDQNDNTRDSKARRVSTDSSVFSVASTHTTALVKSESGVETANGVSVSDAEHDATANAASVSAAEQEESMQSIGAWIQDLFHSDNVKVDAALYDLYLNLDKDNRKCEIIVAEGGCLALVLLVKKFLKKPASRRFPGPDQVMEVDEVELGILVKSLDVITDLTYHMKCRSAMSAVGGVEAVVEVMRTFPKRRKLQCSGCHALLNLVYDNIIGMNQAVETGGIEVLLAAANNHLDSDDVCEHAFGALENVISGSKKNTTLFICSGGGAVAAKVGEEWPDDDGIQTQVRIIAKLIAAEMNS
jgi:hypothetical protein